MSHSPQRHTMYRHVTRFATLVLCVLAVVGPATPAGAVSLSGVMLYSVDDFGNPSGLDWDTEQLGTGMVWRTERHAHWYGLGVSAGLPPASLGAPLLNTPDFRLEVPLYLGDNTFTVVAQGGGGGGGDAQRFVLNIFLDGQFDLPAASVLLARHDAPERLATMRNRGDVVLTFAAEPVRFPSEPVYDDGAVRVFVPTAYFGWDDATWRADLVSPGVPEPDGKPDVVGFFSVVVDEAEPPDAPRVGGGAPGLAVPNVDVPLAPRLVPGAAPLPEQGRVAPGPAAQAPTRATDSVDDSEQGAGDPTEATPHPPTPATARPTGATSPGPTPSPQVTPRTPPAPTASTPPPATPSPPFRTPPGSPTPAGTAEAKPR